MRLALVLFLAGCASAPDKPNGPAANLPDAQPPLPEDDAGPSASLADAVELPALVGHLEVLQANLSAEHPKAVREAAASLALGDANGTVEPALWAIDDPDTREVDDALSVAKDGELVRVDVDIADAAAFVSRGDPIDREAADRRRANSAPLWNSFRFANCGVRQTVQKRGAPTAIPLGIQCRLLRTLQWVADRGRQGDAPPSIRPIAACCGSQYTAKP